MGRDAIGLRGIDTITNKGTVNVSDINKEKKSSNFVIGGLTLPSARKQTLLQEILNITFRITALEKEIQELENGTKKAFFPNNLEKKKEELKLLKETKALYEQKLAEEENSNKFSEYDEDFTYNDNDNPFKKVAVMGKPSLL